MTCAKCQHETARKFGTYGRQKIQRYHCRSCGATFIAARRKPLGKHCLDFEKAAHIVSLLMEGVSVRGISRLTGVHKTTILAVLVTVGWNCRSILDRYVRKVRPHFVQADELWTFVHTKEGHLAPGSPTEWGDAYTWIAMDSETKLVISHLVGKRDAEHASAFVKDFSERVVGRCQLTTDGFKPYLEAVEEHFGADIDFAQLIKIYGKPDNAGPDWYGPGKVIETVPTPISGDPDEAHICTSHIERGNLSMRTSLRRFTRLALGFSKKLDNLKATVALYIAWYNFCRVHMSLRVTPAMEAGLTNHVWTVEELLGASTRD